MSKVNNREDPMEPVSQPDAPITALYKLTTDDSNGYHLNKDSNHPPQSPIRRERPRTLEKHKTKRFTYLDTAFIVKGVATYIFDVVTDIIACVRYFTTTDILWGIMTLMFVLVASVTVQVASFRWFVDDYTHKNKSKPKRGICKKVMDWSVWIVIHVLQLGTINRYLRCLYFGWKSRESKRSFQKYYIWKVFEQRDLTMLRLLEAFIEAGPQLVLQIYILLHVYLESKLPEFYWITALSALSSLLSLSWALEAYHKALRESLECKNDMSYCGVAFRYIWRVSMITSRVSAMALFALQFKYYIFPAVVFHWALMTIWLISQETEFCQTKTEEWLFCCVIAVVHIFCFFNMKEGRTRLRIVIYYTMVLFENSIMAGLWYYYSGMYIEHNYGFLALSFIWAGFFIGIITMAIYYACFHPNNYNSFKPSDVESSLSQTSGYGTDTGIDTLEGVSYEDYPDGVFNRTKMERRHLGNLFSKSGRRYLYWLDAYGQDDTGIKGSSTEDENQNVTGKEEDQCNDDQQCIEVQVDGDYNNSGRVTLQSAVCHETSV